MMVQRTNARQAEKVWLHFTREFPTPETAQAAPEDHLLRVLAPLGLRWRIDNVLKVLRNWPQDCLDLEALSALPGVGPYVISMVRVAGLGEPVAVVDNNIVRIYGRFFGLKTTDSTRRQAAFMALCEAMLSKEKPAEFTWALLDLGGTVCTPRAPKCDQCPLSPRCVSRRRPSTEALP